MTINAQHREYRERNREKIRESQRNKYRNDEEFRNRKLLANKFYYKRPAHTWEKPQFGIVASVKVGVGMCTVLYLDGRIIHARCNTTIGSAIRNKTLVCGIGDIVQVRCRWKEPIRAGRRCTRVARVLASLLENGLIDKINILHKMLHKHLHQRDMNIGETLMLHRMFERHRNNEHNLLCEASILRNL